MYHTEFPKKINKIIVGMLTILAANMASNVYAYDFNGTYTGSQKAIIRMQVNNNIVHASAHCSPINCEWKTRKIFLTNNGKTLVVGLEPLNKDMFYATLILTQTTNESQIQSVLIRDQSAFTKIESLNQNSVAGYSEILTKIVKK